MPHGDWRAKLEVAASPEQRKAILVQGFASNLAQLGKYEYVAETTVLRPIKDRPLYCLFYATRHEKGIEVFRDCQADALKEQSKTRAAIKIKHAEAQSGQGEIFESLHDMGPDDLTAFQDAERRAAEVTLLTLTPEQPDSIRYEKLWPLVLVRHIVRRTDVNQIAARLHREGKLLIPDSGDISVGYAGPTEEIDSEPVLRPCSFSSADLVIGGAEQRTLLVDLLKSAQRRMIIHSTFLDAERLKALLDPIRLAWNCPDRC